MITADDFRTTDVFHDQPEEDLEWLASVSEEFTAGENEKPFKRGDEATEMMVVLDGSFQAFAFNGGQRMLYATVEAGSITGLLPFSRMKTYEGEAIAVTPVRVARIHKRHFMEMISRMPEVGKRLVGRMTDRVRESSRSAQQREKMVSLGKLSAGLAHELNNPAAAIRRSVSDLRERLEAMPNLVKRLTAHGLTPEQVDAARGALIACDAPTPGTLSTLERSDKEDELADWLEDHDVPHAYIVAEVLADEGVGATELERMADHVEADALADVILWIEKGMAADRLLGEIEGAAGRISDLVASIKSYTHMDQAPERQLVNIHHGVNQTLVMLGHAIKKKSIRIEQDYAEDLPEVCAYPGEINQVWTNLLDNAIDAVDDGGCVRISTRREGALACITIEDNGPGIPPEIAGRIFEPFYTTKAPGSGTGLGLDIAQRIVSQHQGTIRLESEPGRTAFDVCLPIDVPPPVSTDTPQLDTADA